MNTRLRLIACAITESLSLYAAGAHQASPDDASVTSSAASRVERLSETIRNALRQGTERLEKRSDALWRCPKTGRPVTRDLGR